MALGRAALPDCSHVRCIAPDLATTLAPGSFGENNFNAAKRTSAMRPLAGAGCAVSAEQFHARLWLNNATRLAETSRKAERGIAPRLG